MYKLSVNTTNTAHITTIPQLDGDMSLSSNEDSLLENPEGCQIPVIISTRIHSRPLNEERGRILKTIKRIGIKPKSLDLPTIMCLNPRSLYGRTEYLADIIREYQVDVACISESWNRDNNPLTDIINIDNHRLYMNVKQRSQRGGKPGIIVNEAKYIVKQPCPSLFTVPSNIEATWLIIRPRNKQLRTKEVDYLAICSYYYSKLVTNSIEDLYDHFAEAFNVIQTKYGRNIQYAFCGDSNRLDLDPIINLSPGFQQVVKVPTRFNPLATLDTIISSLSRYYIDPITKPPIGVDESVTGRPSDHHIVLWRPLFNMIPQNLRSYRTISFHPLLDSKINF